MCIKSQPEYSQTYLVFCYKVLNKIKNAKTTNISIFSNNSFFLERKHNLINTFPATGRLENSY